MKNKDQMPVKEKAAKIAAFYDGFDLLVVQQPGLNFFLLSEVV